MKFHFNKIFKQILLENNLSIQATFPISFQDIDSGLEFIFDIMPTFGVQYNWRTLEDLQSIPELVSALQNTDRGTRLGIAEEFQQQAFYKEDELNATKNPEDKELIQQSMNELLAIASWISRISNMPIQEDVLDNPLDISGKNDEFTTPNEKVVKQVRPRHYRRGLKALSLANRRLYNQQHAVSQPTEFNEPEQPINDKINKVSKKIVSQQPLTKSTIMPVAGVDRPLGPKPKQNFRNLVYEPSLTQLTKQTAKKRCLAARKKLVAENNELEFTTDYSQPAEPVIRPKKSVEEILEPENPKQLCIVCKEYVIPKKSFLSNGKEIYECPKCGLRLSQGNFNK